MIHPFYECALCAYLLTIPENKGRTLKCVLLINLFTALTRGESELRHVMPFFALIFFIEKAMNPR
jgi:hypothetical protein